MEKKIILGTLAGGVAYFLLGWLFYGILLMDFNAGETTIEGLYKEMPDFLILFLGNLFSAYLLTVIISRWTHASSAVDGAKTGLFVGFMLGAGFDLTMYATSNIMSFKGALVDIVVTAVMTSLVGAVIAAITSSSKKAA